MATADRVVLLIEDNKDNRIIYTTILEHHGYRVIQAVDGVRGIEMAEEYQPHLILLDLELPKLDGWQVVAEIKARHKIAGTPVLAVSAHGDRAERRRSAEAGFAGYLAEPIEPRHLLHAVERWLPTLPASGHFSAR